MPHTLLLADDSVTIQRVIELTFADEDIQVVAVGDGDQAIQRLDAAPPDIVLADIGMPGKNGYEVAQYIRQTPKLCHIPVVLLTGAFEPVDQARADEAGCDGVLAKPFEPQLVIGRVKDLLAKGRDRAGNGADSIDVALPPPAAAPATAAVPQEAAPASLLALDDYFDRLDAAFSSLNTSSPSAPTSPALKPSGPTSAPTISVSPPAASALDSPPPPLSDLARDVAPTRADAPPPAAAPEVDWFAAAPAPDSPEPSWAAPAQFEHSPPEFPPSHISAQPNVAEASAASEATPAIGADLVDPHADVRSEFGDPEMPSLESATMVPVAAAPSTDTTAAVAAPSAPPSLPVVPAAEMPSLDAAFAAFLAAEDADGASAEWPGVAHAPAAPAPAITDAFVDDVVRRVLERLTDAVVRETTADLVSRIAERLVKGEIDKIKAAAK